MLDRRSFLRRAAPAVLGAALVDPEQLLWEPGKRMHFDIHRPPLGLSVKTIDGYVKGGPFPVRMDVLYGWSELPEIAPEPDPFVHLDPKMRARIQEALDQAAQNLADSIDKAGMELVKQTLPQGYGNPR